jgi:DNA-binding CsgD family transcriptional regulator
MLSIHAPPQHPSEEFGHRTQWHQLPQQIVDQIDCGLIVCDAQGHMLHANRSAQRELHSAQILILQDGVLCCRGPSANELAAAIKAAAGRGLRRLVNLQDSPPLMVVVMPLDRLPGTDPMVLVMIGRRSLCTPLGLELLAVQHRLTWAEQRVLRAIVGGVAVRNIATDNGVAMSTVRTQVQSIRDKLGVGNIDALLLIEARIPPVPSCH